MKTKVRIFRKDDHVYGELFFSFMNEKLDPVFGFRWLSSAKFTDWYGFEVYFIQNRDLVNNTTYLRNVFREMDKAGILGNGDSPQPQAVIDVLNAEVYAEYKYNFYPVKKSGANLYKVMYNPAYSNEEQCWKTILAWNDTEARIEAEKSVKGGFSVLDVENVTFDPVSLKPAC